MRIGHTVVVVVGVYGVRDPILVDIRVKGGAAFGCAPFVTIANAVVV